MKKKPVNNPVLKQIRCQVLKKLKEIGCETKHIKIDENNGRIILK